MAPNDDRDSEDAARWDAVEEATELLREGEHDAAMRELRGVLDRDPRNPYAHFFLAAAHFEREEYEPARAAYQQALSLSPGYLGALIGLGHALRMLDRLDEAIAAGTRALSLAGEGGDADAHHLLGLAYAARGDARRAVTHLERFLEGNPELEARYDVEEMLQELRGQAGPLKPV